MQYSLCTVLTAHSKLYKPTSSVREEFSLNVIIGYVSDITWLCIITWSVGGTRLHLIHIRLISSLRTPMLI
jgi:hypothetical protein